MPFRRSVPGAERPTHHRDFRLLLAGLVVDTAGNATFRVVLPFAVLDVLGISFDRPGALTEAAGVLGLVVGAQTVGVVALMLVGGVVADRVSRSVVLTWSNAVASVIDAVLAWSVISGWATIPLMIVLAFLGGGSAAMSSPAAMAIVPETVPARLLQEANALSSSARSVVRVLSLVLGGGLAIAIGPGWGIAFNALTFAVVAFLFSAITARPLARQPSRVIDDLREGWQIFVERRWAWVVVLSFLVQNAAFSGTLLVLGPLIAKTTFGEEWWGWVLASESIGLLVVAFVLSRSSHRARLSNGMIGAALTAPFMAVLGVQAPIIGVVLTAGVIMGIGIGYFDVAWNVSLQHHMPEEALSRVYSVDALGSLAAVPIGQMAVGAIAAVAGVTTTIYALAGLVLVLSLVVLAVPEVRHLPPAASKQAGG